MNVPQLDFTPLVMEFDSPPLFATPLSHHVSPFVIQLF
jgi:hypothetical protein